MADNCRASVCASRRRTRRAPSSVAAPGPGRRTRSQSRGTRRARRSGRGTRTRSRPRAPATALSGAKPRSSNWIAIWGLGCRRGNSYSTSSEQSTILMHHLLDCLCAQHPSPKLHLPLSSNILLPLVPRQSLESGIPTGSGHCDFSDGKDRTNYRGKRRGGAGSAFYLCSFRRIRESERARPHNCELV